jgi:hypothetical protein
MKGREAESEWKEERQSQDGRKRGRVRMKGREHIRRNQGEDITGFDLHREGSE